MVILGLTAGEAKATSYDLKNIIKGATFDTENNFLRADFQTVTPGTVTLTLTSFLSNPDYYIPEVAFNVDPNIIPSSLGFTIGSVTGTVLGLSDIAHTTQDTQHLTGSGNIGNGFDVLINFPTANKDRFNDGTVVLTITGTGITADSFDFLNTTGVADVGARIDLAGGTSIISNVPTSNVPIPSAAWLLASGLLGIVVIRRFDRWRRSEAG